MKIAMLTPYFYPHTGGTEKYVKDLSLELTKFGHQITVFSCNVPKKAGAKEDETIEGGIKVKRLPAIDIVYLPVTMAFDKKMLEGFDIAHAHCPPFGFVRSLAGKINIPLVVTYHCDTTMSEKFFGLPMPKFVIDGVENSTNGYAKTLLPKANAIISTSQSYASSSPVLKNFKPNIVPIGVHFEQFDAVMKKIGISEETRRPNQVLFLGRLAANKGVDYLIKAVPKVLEKFPDTHFIITGEGEEKASLLKLIKKLKVEKFISFYGKITLEILVNLYATSTMFVLPSINRLEAFGIVQIEAMACSTPVICTDIPGPNSVMEVGKSGLLVPPRNPGALADAIIEMLSNPEKARAMGRRGRELVETKYNWATIGRQVENIYKGLLAK